MSEPLKTVSLSGIFSMTMEDGSIHDLKIPGTLDESNIGYRDPGRAFSYDAPDEPVEYREDVPEAEQVLLSEWLSDEEEGTPFSEAPVRPPILSRYTRKYSYEGPARISRLLSCREVPGTRLFFEVERARELTLLIDGEEILPYAAPTLSTPQVFEVTGHLDGDHMLTVISDNRYEDLPRKDILYSGTASDEAQTNWNGLLGYVRLREEEECFVDRITVRTKEDRLTVYLEISAPGPRNAILRISSSALEEEYEKTLLLTKEFTAIVIPDLKLRDGIEKWDEEEGQLHEITVALNGVEKTASFGVRDLGCTEEGRLTLNGRTVFLRGETNSVVFPETGYAPTDVSSWKKILNQYRAYGANFVRFHSYCPPEACFRAADELGFLLMPELSCRNPVNAMETEEAQEYYMTEMREILLTYGSHPSFVMLSFGDSLISGSSGKEFRREMLRSAKKIDPTRLYTPGSDPENGREGPDGESDFYIASHYRDYLLRACDSTEKEEAGLRGFLNRHYPSAKENYNEAVAALRESYHRPVIGYEAGQYGILPDFSELDLFSRFLSPDNITARREKAEKAGLLPQWKKRIEASGELALLSYRAEVEAVLRTPGMSGITLLGLQDYPGRGTALVGMMNTHMIPKGFSFADPKRFRRFFGPVVPLVLLDRYTYEQGDTLSARVVIANYGKEDLQQQASYTLSCGDIAVKGTLPGKNFPAGRNTDAGTLILPLKFDGMDEREAVKFTLTVRIGRYENDYPVYVYPKFIPICPEEVYETDSFDYNTLRVLEEGGTVFLTPRAAKETIPGSVKTQFTTDFWTKSLYPKQAGTMGQYIENPDHPVFRYFPTDFHTGYQWFSLAGSRAVEIPRRIRSLVTVTDRSEELRNLSQLFEFRVGNGCVLFSSMGIKEQMEHPEVRALLTGIYEYLESYDFSPSESLKPEEVRRLVSAAAS